MTPPKGKAGEVLSIRAMLARIVAGSMIAGAAMLVDAPTGGDRDGDD